MKSRITSYTSRGFLLPEILIAFSLMALFIISAVILSVTMQALRAQAQKQLTQVESAIKTMEQVGMYGDDTIITASGPLTSFISDYTSAWGQDSCSVDFTLSSTTLYTQGINLGLGNISTGIEVRDKTAYITADSSVSSASDFYIVDMANPSLPVVLSTLNTGPGLSDIVLGGYYAYVINKGTTNHLQIIDIHSRTAPFVLVKYRLPLPQASTTPTIAVSLFYRNGYIYVGTQKWEGSEFLIIDVRDILNPQVVGSFETNTQVNDIYVRGDYAYLATSDSNQMQILDIHNPSTIVRVSTFTPTGWETQVGTIISTFMNELYFGRTTGGFNNIHNDEIFHTSSTQPIITNLASHDIAGGVYGIIARPPNILLVSHEPGQEFQVWNDILNHKLLSMSLGFRAQSVSCDGSDIYFATGDEKGIAVIKNL